MGNRASPGLQVIDFFVEQLIGDHAGERWRHRVPVDRLWWVLAIDRAAGVLSARRYEATEANLVRSAN